MPKLRGFAVLALLLALLAQTASADPVTPTDNPRDREPVTVLLVQTSDGWVCYEISAGIFIGYCGGDPVNATDPMGTDYIYEYNGSVFYQGQRRTTGPRGTTKGIDVGSPIRIGTTDGTYIKLAGDVGGGIVHQATLEYASKLTFSGSATESNIHSFILRTYQMPAGSATPYLDPAISFTTGVRNGAAIAGAGVAVVATGGALLAAGSAGGTAAVAAEGSYVVGAAAGSGTFVVKTAIGFGAVYAASKATEAGLEEAGVPEDFAEPISEAVVLVGGAALANKLNSGALAAEAEASAAPKQQPVLNDNGTA